MKISHNITDGMPSLQILIWLVFRLKKHSLLAAMYIERQKKCCSKLKINIFLNGC